MRELKQKLDEIGTITQLQCSDGCFVLNVYDVFSEILTKKFFANTGFVLTKDGPNVGVLIGGRLDFVIHFDKDKCSTITFLSPDENKDSAKKFLEKVYTNSSAILKEDIISKIKKFGTIVEDDEEKRELLKIVPGFSPPSPEGNLVVKFEGRYLQRVAQKDVPFREEGYETLTRKEFFDKVVKDLNKDVKDTKRGYPPKFSMWGNPREWNIMAESADDSHYVAITSGGTLIFLDFGERIAYTKKLVDQIAKNLGIK